MFSKLDTVAPSLERLLPEPLLESLRSGPLSDTSDVSVAEGLLDLVQDELTAYGTDGTNELNDKQIALAIRALEAVTGPTWDAAQAAVPKLHDISDR